MWILISYLVIINVLAFVLMRVDKRNARKKKQRIAESILFIVAIAGGSIGTLAGMYIFRHKTKHRRFTGGIPMILTLQVLIALFIISIVTGGISFKFNEPAALPSLPLLKRF